MVLFMLKVSNLSFESSVCLLELAVLILEGLVCALESQILTFKFFHLFLERGHELLFTSEITDFELISVPPAGRLVIVRVPRLRKLNLTRQVNMVVVVVVVRSPSLDLICVLPTIRRGAARGTVAGCVSRRTTLVTMAVAAVVVATTFIPSLE
jgi:hypothetical protein